MICVTHRHSFAVPATLLLLGAVPAIGHVNTNPAAPPQVYNYYAAGLRFEASEYVDGSKYGLVGNGITDNTIAFRALLGHGGRAIHISAGTYVTGKLDIPGNTVLLLDPGVIIKDSGKLGTWDKLVTISNNNIYIRGQGAEVASNLEFYHGGEYRAGVYITGATDVVIDGLQSIDNSGDGFYIGSNNAGKPDRNVTLENCSALHNFRNGLSIVSGVNISVLHCSFSYTRGTAPQYGIDIEPNVSSDPLADIKIVDARTMENANGGISIYLNPKYDPPNPISVSIVNHQSRNEYRPYHSFGLDRVPGTVTYNGKELATP